MYIDSEDFSHLATNLLKDWPLLSKKMELMKSQLEKKTKKRKSVELYWNELNWKNPETKTQWNIHYAYSKKEGKLYVSYIPNISIEHNGIRNYLSFVNESDGRLLKLRGIIVKVFKGHFISRFKERLGETEMNPYAVINEFILSGEVGLVEDFKQNEKWILYLYRYGIAMIRVHDNFIVFDTFITLDELKTEQKKAINRYLNDLHPMPFLVVTRYLLENPTWMELITNELFKSKLATASEDKSPKAQEFFKYFLEYDDNLKKLRESANR